MHSHSYVNSLCCVRLTSRYDIDSINMARYKSPRPAEHRNWLEKMKTPRDMQHSPKH